MVTSHRDMDTVTETERQALTRLLGKAKTEGIRLFRDRAGRHFASSTSEPGKLHYVTGYSCDCRGFLAHQRCKHHAALLSALGWLTIDPEPQTPMAITVTHTGAHYSLTNDPEWIEPCSTIVVDGEVKVKIVGDTYNLSVWWLQDGKPIDDLTGCTPPYLDHYETVDHWIGSLDALVEPHVPMQDAGLFPAGEFIDAHPIAA